MNNEPEELDDETIEKMVAMKEQGDPFYEAGDYKKALQFYWTAYKLLPEPVEIWEATNWILAYIGDAYFMDRDFEKGYQVLNQAMHAPGAVGNPFIHMRFGQCAYELGREERAKDELMRAYMGGGSALFAAEDGKYLKFLARFAMDIQFP